LQILSVDSSISANKHYVSAWKILNDIVAQHLVDMKLYVEVVCLKNKHGNKTMFMCYTTAE